MYRDYKPFGFFSILALILALISTLFFIPVLLDYFSTGLVLKVPTLIVCGFAMLAAIQSFFASLILSNMAQKVEEILNTALIASVKRNEGAEMNSMRRKDLDIL